MKKLRADRTRGVLAITRCTIFFVFQFTTQKYKDRDKQNLPIPVPERSKAWICSRSPAGVVGSKPAGAWIFVCCECCVFVR
jgi:hypothetical protein